MRILTITAVLLVSVGASVASAQTGETSFRGFSLGMAADELPKRLPAGCRLTTANQDNDYVMNVLPVDILLGDVSHYRIDCGSAYAGSISLNDVRQVDKMLFMPALFNASSFTYSQFIGALQEAYDLNFVEATTPTYGGGTRLVYEARTAFGETVGAAQMLGQSYIVVWPSTAAAIFDK